MAKEKKINGNEISRRFTTMMPLDVLIDFTQFAKKNAITGLGKFDFSVALRMLLERSKINERIDELEDQITILEMRSKEPIQESKPLTFGSGEKEVDYEV